MANTAGAAMDTIMRLAARDGIVSSLVAEPGYRGLR
jgi:hypothetical protein